MPVRNALEALTMRPTQFLRSAWPWRSLAYLIGGALLGFATILAVIGLLLAGIVLSVVVIGVAGYVATVLAGVAVARLERWRMRLVDDTLLPDPHGRPSRPGLRAWVPFVPPGVLFGLSYVSLYEAFYRGRLSVVSPLVATESLFGVGLSALFLRHVEGVGRRLVLGAGLVVAGGILIGLSR